MHTHKHTHIHTDTHIYTHTHLHTLTETHKHTHIKIHIHIDTYKHTHIHTHIDECTCSKEHYCAFFNLPILDIWPHTDHTVCGLWGHLSLHSSFKHHSCCRIINISFPFVRNYISLYDIPYYSYTFIIWWTFVLLLLFPFSYFICMCVRVREDMCCMNICMCMCVCACAGTYCGTKKGLWVPALMSLSILFSWISFFY